MKRTDRICLLSTVVAWLGFMVLAAFSQGMEQPVLARVEVAGPVASFTLPVHAHLLDGRGREYLVAFATRRQLGQTGWPFRILHTRPPADFVLAAERRPGARTAAADKVTVVYDDGANWLVWAPGREAEPLAELGFALRRLPRKPMRWDRPVSQVGAVAKGVLLDSGPDPFVAEMIDHVSSNALNRILRRLIGSDPTVAGGDLYTISTRYTVSGVPIEKANRFCHERLRALGVNVEYKTWSGGGRTGTNVVLTLVGGTKSNEIVVAVAHLDDVPSSGVAPGADDNASGSAAVLMAAGIASQYRFERTLRFLLVTGEEQGLYGSAAYAVAAAATGDNIVAVFNMDMLAWDGNGDGALNLHTRVTSAPGYSNDLAIAQTFTNVVAKYGLSAALKPFIRASGEWRSDHSSFWDHGYPAILAIEEDLGDFNPYYHTVQDSLDKFKWPYYLNCVKASVGTVAHLAGPVDRVSLDVVEVATSASTGVGIGASVLHARHEPGATESGTDSLDVEWSDRGANTNAGWLKIHTTPGVADLGADSRPPDSQTVFLGDLAAVVTNGTTFSCTNRLRFDFVAPPMSNRVYLARVHVDGRYTATSNDFDCVTNLRNVVEAGGYLDLPALAGVSNGVVYGTCDLTTRFVDTDSTHCILRMASVSPTQTLLAASTQLGVRVCDTVEVSTNLLQADGWVVLTAFTNDVLPDLTTFDAGWSNMARSVDTTALTNSADAFFRLRRDWLGP